MSTWPDALENLPKEPLADSPEYRGFQQFARLTAEKREHNRRLKEIEAKLRALEPVLLTYLSQGLEAIKVEGYLMFPVRQHWIYPFEGVSRQSICEALKMSDLGRLVFESYSTMALSAYVTELEEHSQLIGSDPEALRKLLPPALAALVDVRPGFRLRVQDKRKNKTNETEDRETGDDNDNE